MASTSYRGSSGVQTNLAVGGPFSTGTALAMLAVAIALAAHAVDARIPKV